MTKWMALVKAGHTYRPTDRRAMDRRPNERRVNVVNLAKLSFALSLLGRFCLAPSRVERNLRQPNANINTAIIIIDHFEFDS